MPTRVTKRELRQLGEDLGAVITSDGPRWTATFPDKASLFYTDGRAVELHGTRQRLGECLRGIKRSEVKTSGSNTKANESKG